MIGSAGELLVEFVREGTAGHSTPGRYAGPFPSGAPGIFIDQAARMGARTVFAGAVGADAFGAVVRDRLLGAGVAPDLIATVPDRPTGTAFVAYDDAGSRAFVFALGAAAWFPDDAAGFLAARTEVFHVSGSTLGDPAMRARIVALAERLHGAGVALSVDPNVRPELGADAGYLAALRGLVARAAFVLPSEADAALLYPGAAFADWAGPLVAAGARAVALKRGAAGAVAMDRDGSVARPGLPVAVTDPTGAGDCFCATFLVRLLQGRSLGDATGDANAAGAHAVTRLGPMEGNASPEAFLAGATSPRR